MVRIGKIVFWIVLQCCFVTAFAIGDDMAKVKQNIYDSYLRVLNVEPVLRQRVAEIRENSGNPDMMIRELQEGVNIEAVDTYLKTLGADGSWAELNYNDDSRSGWQPSFHSERLMVMTKAYRDPAGKYFGNEELGKAIHRGMEFWFAGNFRCRNWWYNQIGVPKMLGTVFLLMDPEMSADEKAKAIKYMEGARFGMTGQNSVWLAENVLIRALLQENESLFVEARDIILKELRMNEKGEGIRPDWSFHQHGAQLQFGNYGLAFANTMSYWARMFRDTRFALTDEQISVLRNYLLEGMQWIVWKRNMDIGSCGRQLFMDSQDGKALSYGKAIRNMQEADPEYAKVYNSLYKTHVLVNGQLNRLVGNRYFHFSDFGVHRNKNWYSTLKMSSLRVIGSEIVNSENLSGYYLGDGAMFVYSDGDEFRDIFPVWDWTKLPGVTCYDSPDVFAGSKAYTQNQEDFVGGVSNGEIGVSAIVLNKNGLSGRKSYFYTGEAIVCVGSGITGDKSSLVTTSVAQCLKDGDVYSHQEPGMKTKAFYHDGVAYVFPENADVKLKDGMQSGNWGKVARFYDTAVVEKEVFGLWLEHGKAPRNGGYCYGVIPGLSEKGWQKKAGRFPAVVLKQDENVHAIAHGDCWQMVFFAPNEVKLSDKLTLSADKGCLVMMKPEKKGYRFWVSEPTWKQEKITFRLSGKWGGEGCVCETDGDDTVVTVPVSGLRGGNAEFILSIDKNK